MARVLIGDAPHDLLVNGEYVTLQPGDTVPLPDSIPVGMPTEHVDDTAVAKAALKAAEQIAKVAAKAAETEGK
jgi:hypothetical protein